MRPQKVEDLEVVNGLMSVFRAKGYDGASLSELAIATGLKKASLYHRFPGGKKDMVVAVFNYLESLIKKNIYIILTDTTKNTDTRLNLVIANIRDIYKDGIEVCMYRSLSLDSGMLLFSAEIQRGITLFIRSFELFGIEKGMSMQESKDNANATFIEIQGGLVLSKSMNEKAYFLEVLEKIKTRYS